MAGLPDITVAGTLTADPELRFTANGTAVANFTVAANDRRYDKDRGEWVDNGATFMRCTVWRDTAEHVAESLQKGRRVLLTGSLRQRDWETKEGEKRTTFEVDVTEIGPSLKWAIAKVAKATRNSTDDGAERSDGWATEKQVPDEPPF